MKLKKKGIRIMTEIRTLQVIPQAQVVKFASTENTGKAYLLNEPIQDQVVIEKEKKTGGAGKGFASAVLPGLGQILDGRIGAGLGFLGSMIGFSALQHINGKKFADNLAKRLPENGRKMEMLDKAWKAGKKDKVIKVFVGNIKKAFKELPTGNKVAAVTLPVVMLGTYIANIVNAAKGKKD